MHEGHQETEPLPSAIERVGRAVLDGAFAVHKSLGPGLLESVYEACLAEELLKTGLRVERQLGVPVAYGDVRIDVGYRLDLLVQSSVVVEIKAIDALASIHAAQILTYMRFADVRLGYLINFNTVMLKNGLRRVVL
ncbi:MAG: GxxExxY protein [Alphaproteobacteria bacterium]|nr:GxxExxY protein [Alphaproteobacteria bacterium]MBU1526749.1 GxxExxY protein [Alphaproteobacteria bacterium]MBU2117911.1 GxxExxY protein [Alphaproteobacteria bacterium]MBU2351031.1 GxxExxY protein [Alphaproteobacteria bacterium]MBU2382864.1 GxxExxY protein [Alphaproteobacteria bacterium]